MNRSTTVTAVFVQLLIVILPLFGIQVGSTEATNAFQTITVIVTGLWIWYQRVQKGDIKVFGGYKTKYSDS